MKEAKMKAALERILECTQNPGDCELTGLTTDDVIKQLEKWTKEALEKE